MFSSMLSAATTQIIMWVVIGVVLVLMVVLTIVPQKKRQKEQQNMMNSLAVGTKIMTIGRMVGKITQVNSDNTLIVNVGTEASPTLIVIDKQAVGLVLENVAAPVTAVSEQTEDKAEENSAIDALDGSSVTDSDSNFDPLKDDAMDSFDVLDDQMNDQSKKRNKKK